jgi:hypothetical protein
MDFQKGAPLYDDDSRNQVDESFSDKYHDSKTNNASSLSLQYLTEPILKEWS